MTKSLTSTIAAAVIASVSFGGAALADGDYYVGASQDTASHIDRVQTSSIGERSYVAHQQVAQTVNRGDYYEGANRPQ
jgi:hypothetical protein